MTYLARKITRAKWESGEDIAPCEIGADAVTADMRTSNNGLSFWKMEMPSNGDILWTVLALATGAERIDKLDLAWFSEERVNATGISVRPSEGRTPVVSLRDHHVDAIKLDLHRLSILARFIFEALSKGQHRRFTKREIIKIILDAIDKKLVSINDLKPDVKREIEKELID